LDAIEIIIHAIDDLFFADAKITNTHMSNKVAVVIGDNKRSKKLGNFEEKKALKLAKQLGDFLTLKENTPRDYGNAIGTMWISVYSIPVYAHRVETKKRDDSPVRKSNKED
jgi:hypothetical protein